MKAKFLSLVIALIALFSFSNAYAQNPHFVKGPDYRISGTQISFNGKMAGLGSYQTYYISIENGSAEATVDCRNHGGSVVASQQDVDVPIQTVQPVPFTTSKSGQLSFSFSVTAELTGNPCPNPNWTPSIRSLDDGSFSGTIVVKDAQGNIVASQTL